MGMTIFYRAVEPVELFGLVVHEIGFGFIEKDEPPITHSANLYQLHVVTSGAGEFTEFPVSAGDAFIVTPGTQYRETGEFKQYWIDFYGFNAEAVMSKANIRRENHVYHLGEYSYRAICAAFRELSEPEARDSMTPMLMVGTLLRLISLFGEGLRAETRHDHVELMKSYIRSHIAEELTLSQIAEHVHLAPRYANQIFKRRELCSISEFIMKIRLDSALFLLGRTNLALAEIARQVGYRDALYFSRIFKRRFGIAPSLWRKERRRQESLRPSQ